MRPLDATRHAADEFPFSLELRTRFAETDAMGVVHHAAFLPYLESARVEYLRALGHAYRELRERDGLDFAVIGLQLAYLAPLHFDDVVRVHVGLAHVRRASFAMEYLVERDGVAAMTGFTHHAALVAGRPTRLPAWLIELAGP